MKLNRDSACRHDRFVMYTDLLLCLEGYGTTNCVCVSSSCNCSTVAMRRKLTKDHHFLETVSMHIDTPLTQQSIIIIMCYAREFLAFIVTETAQTKFRRTNKD